MSTSLQTARSELGDDMTGFSAIRVSETKGGINLSWGAEHRDGDGNLICRQASIGTPRGPTCLKPGCMFRYLKRVILYILLGLYHVKRAAYAEAHRHDVIPEKYRTGEPSPENIRQAITANLAFKFRR